MISTKISNSIYFLTFSLLLLISSPIFSQGLSIGTCPTIDKRNNGNGQYGSSAGYFPNDPNNPKQNNPVAANVVGTVFQNVSFIPNQKTGYVNFYWDSQSAVTNLPVITRVWLTATGSTSATLSAIKFGPPPPAVVVGNRYFFNYSFYGQNMPPAGKVTLEFADPYNGVASFRCTYDLQSGSPTTEPTLSCGPTINTQPTNLSICGDAAAAQFTINASGFTTVTWQQSNDNFATSTDVSNASPYTISTSQGTSTLSISTPTAKDGLKFRAVLTGVVGCGSTTSDIVSLIAKPKPTASFTSTNLCSTTSQSVGVNLTGTAPWSITYTKTEGATVTTSTISNITNSPYYLTVSGAATYAITTVSDAYCSNIGSPLSSTTLNTNLSVTPSNLNLCYGLTGGNISFTGTGSANQYTLTTGVRAMPGFSNRTGISFGGSSPINVTGLPTANPGVYDFNLSVANSTTGCASVSAPFTITILALPSASASAGNGTICQGATANLTASPAGLTYAWTIQGNATVLGTSSTYSPTVNSNTTFNVKVTDGNGCFNTASVDVATQAGPTLSVSAASSTICNGNATTLSASGGNTYSWSPSTGLSATSGDVVVASPSTTTTYQVTSANITGCQSVGTVIVTVNSPNITVTGSQTICAGSSSTLTASGGASYLWYPSTGLYTNAGCTTAYTTGTNASTVYAKPNSTTTYYAEGTDANGCKKVASTTQTLRPAPVGGITTSSPYYFCTQGVTSFDLNIQVTENATSPLWYYSTDNITYTNFTSSTAVTGATIAPTQSGSSPNVIYTVTVSGYGSSGYTGPTYFKLNFNGTSCSYSQLIKIVDTKSASSNAPAPTATATTICSGNSTVLSVGTLSGLTTVQWQQSTDNSTFTNILNATTASITVSPTVNTYYRAVYNGGNGNCGATSTSTLITVISSIGANTVTPTSTCTDGVNNPTLTASAITGGIYQWQTSTTSSSSGFSDVLGATSQNYTLPNNIVASATWYQRIASTSTCATNTSASVVVYAPISNNQISNATTSYCTSTSATLLDGTTPIGGSGTYTYQWKQSTDGTNFSNVASGGTSEDYTTTAGLTQTYYYKRIVTSGGCTDESSIFKITVNTNPTITASPTSSSICAGSSLAITASSNKTGTTYSWSPSTELNVSTGATVTATATTSRTYTVTGTDGNGCTSTATSAVTVTALPSAGTISTTNATICSGSTYSLSGVVSGGTNPKWYTAPEASASYLIASNTASTSGTYYMFTSNTSGSLTCYSSAYKTLTLTISDVSTPTPNSTSLSFCSPATADLTSLEPAPRTGISYEWHTVSSNPTSGDLVATPASVSTGSYYLYAYSNNGNCFGTASTAVSVAINALPSPTLSSYSATAVCQPNSVDLTAYNNTASASNYNFSWYNSNNPIPANLVPTPTAVTSAGTYYLYAVDKTTKCSGGQANGLVISFNAKPAVSISSPSAFCGSDNSRTITATASGVSSPNYDWSYSSDGGANWNSISSNTGVYSGAGTSTLSISNAISPTNLSGYYYRCDVSKSGCNTVSDAAILVGETGSTISSQPPTTVTATGSVASGGSTSISLTYTGNATIQWQVSTNGTTWTDLSNTNPYSGVYTSTLQITGATTGMAGYKYRAVLTDACGSITSNITDLAVTLPLTWVAVTAKKLGTAVKIDWTTASELNTKDFEVQFSNNANNWSPIGNVQAVGLSNGLNNYTFIHTTPQKGGAYNYYRILQTDLDGKYSYSKIVSILFDKPGDEIMIYPNPTSNILNVYLAEAQVIRIFNNVGEVVYKSNQPAGISQINVSKFSKGLYILKANSESKMFLVQ